MKVAICYDRVNKWGGAERVLLILNEMFPDAPLYTSVYDSKKAPWAKKFPKVYTSFLQNILFAKNRHEFLGTLMPFVFESHDFSRYDLVISVTSEAAKGIITLPKTKHICYMLTPTRYLWSHHDEYFENRLLRFISRPFINYLRKWDKIASKRPDKIVAISKTSQKRIKKYYGLDSIVIYPPLSLEISKKKVKKNKDYYLLVSRLVPYKKVNLAVKAFNKLNKKLIVVGTGSQKRKLKSMANSNIEFKGSVTDKELGKLYSGAKALIFPHEEDFGLTSIEAQSFGVPVIALKKGGAKETVIEGKTGILFEKQTPESIMKGVEKFEKLRFNKETIKNNAKTYSKENFKKDFEKL